MAVNLFRTDVKIRLQKIANKKTAVVLRKDDALMPQSFGVQCRRKSSTVCEPTNWHPLTSHFTLMARVAEAYFTKSQLWAKSVEMVFAKWNYAKNTKTVPGLHLKSRPVASMAEPTSGRLAKPKMESTGANEMRLASVYHALCGRVAKQAL